MPYTLGNKCAKNCCKRTTPVQLIVEDIVTCFFGTQCRCWVTEAGPHKCPLSMATGSYDM